MSEPITYNVSVSFSNESTNTNPIVQVSANGNIVIQTMTTQCVLYDHLILQLIPYSNSTIQSACALVDWTENSNLNPSTSLSQLNNEVYNVTNPSFDYYEGPTLFFELNITMNCANSLIFPQCTLKNKSNCSNPEISCVTLGTSILSCINDDYPFPNVFVNITVYGNTAPNKNVGGSIGLLGNIYGTGSITYSLNYINFNGYTSGSSSVLYSSSGNQYWTFPQSVPINYKINSSSQESITNMYKPLMNEQGLNLCSFNSSQFQYDGNNNIDLSMDSIPNLFNDCSLYITTPNNLPFTIYQWMPCGTLFNTGQVETTGGLSNVTETCFSNYETNSNCDSICLGNCLL